MEIRGFESLKTKHHDTHENTIKYFIISGTRK